MTARTAIVTLAIGERHRQRWHTYCRTNWQRYAARHGYDLIVLEQSLDESPRARARSAAWQKLLVLGHPALCDRQRVVWLDSDMLIHPRAPAVADGVALDCVGAVDEFASPTPQVATRALRTWYRVMDAAGEVYCRNETAREFYRAFGFAEGFDQVVQSGLLVLAPRHHRALLEDVYHRYEELPGAHMLMEMRPLSYELLHAGRMHWLDPRFNVLWTFYKAARFPFLLRDPQHPLATRCAADAFAESHFLHFAGAHHDIALVDAQQPPPAVRRGWARPPAVSDPPPRCDVPVALILYNRPEPTARVFAAIRAARPPQLFLIADGPRADRPGDATACAAARAAVAAVDWDCAVHWNDAQTNLGLKHRVESGLDWVFEQVEQAVILEDDCLPHPSFFRFCAELLEHYAADARVLTISGSNFTFGLRDDDAASYAFSRYPLIWGWATWRRAWRLYDPAMREWPEALASGWLRSHLGNARVADYWSHVFQQTAEAQDTWDLAWTFAAWRRGGLSIHPNVNLVSNIGFGAESSHTRDARDAFAELPAEAMQFPLRHPAAVARHAAADELIEQTTFSSTLQRLWRVIELRQRARRGR